MTSTPATTQPRRFSGKTLAAAVIGVAVLVPTASTAAGSFVTITDPGSSNAAAVSAAGRLQVENANTTDLLFRTPVGAQSFAAGTTKKLGTVSTVGYEKIRVVANNRTGSAAPITFRVTILEGQELVAQLATVTLQPRSERTFVIDVPARAVALYAAAGAARGNVATDVLVYGQR